MASTQPPATPPRRASESAGGGTPSTGAKKTPGTPGAAKGRRASTTHRDASGAAADGDDAHKRTPGRRSSSANKGPRRASHSSTTSPAKPVADDATSEGMTSLKNLISEMKDTTAPSTVFGSPSAAGGNRSVSPSTTTNTSPRRVNAPTSLNSSVSGGARKTSSGTTPTTTVVTSTLNPYAGGFQPSLLGPITDVGNEGLITPTATHFDLMTGQPFTTGQTPYFGSRMPGMPGGEAIEDTTNQGHVRSFFPTAGAENGVAAARRYSQGQHQEMQGGASDTHEGLLAEQMRIQAQLESLRIQQEDLLARFEGMQAPSPPPAAPPAGSHVKSPSLGGPQQHRRITSSSSQMGSSSGFGAGLGNFGQNMAAPALGKSSDGVIVAGSLPRGHARRTSVNTKQGSQPANGNATMSPQLGMVSPAMSNAGFSPNMSQTMSPQMGGFSAMGSFQFPPPAAGGFVAPSGNELEYSTSSSHQGGGGHGRRTSSISSMAGWSQSGGSMGGNQGAPTHGVFNLAEAQAHLQQLAMYRASPGHARVPSFGLSGIPGAASQLAMSSYGGGIPNFATNGHQQQPQRKSLFAPYLPQASIPPLLAAGKLVIGTLRVNKRNRSDAYVATDVLDADIYICGSKDRNRALEGDIVAVELLDVDEVWGTKKEKEEKKRKKEESSSFDLRASRENRKQDKKKDDVEVEGQGMLLFEDEEVNDEQKPQFAGHVVAVVERAPGQLFSGMLGVLRPSSAATKEKQDAERREKEGVDLRGGQGNQGSAPPKIVWFRPTDKRVPLIAIPTEQAPADFITNPDVYSDRLFVACIKRWPITSLHPFGTLVEELGTIGDIETETQALLKDCNFSTEDFSDGVLKCLPPTPWAIPERELAKDSRRDFRSQTVFTIDPATAKDLDDALHVVENEDGTFDVGVHIADVSYFVKPNTALDREARKRATTVYLVQKAVPMLPAPLCEELCSLTAGVDKLTFSIVFTLSPEGKTLSTWFGKAIINSAAKLSYADAQDVIDGKSLAAGKVQEGASASAVEESVRKLHKLAGLLRKRRFDSGALKIDNVKVSFTLDSQGLPEDCESFVPRESNNLIEEFMLLANMAVAGKIAAGLPEQALLRRHEPPIERRLEGFVERMKRLGLDMDGQSSGSLMTSIENVQDQDARFTVKHLSTKAMLRAKYFCTGMLDISKYAHYALNVPLYTHFTSPIRRYADVITHRQLEAVLVSGNDAKFNLDTEAVSKIAQNCNVKKDAAKLAQEQSAHLYLCVLIADLTERYGPVIRPATVIGVLDQAFDVVIPEFGIEKRVHVDQMPTENHSYDEHSNSLQIYWKRGVDVLRWLAEHSDDEHLRRVRQTADNLAALDNSSTRKTEDESALFDSDDEDEAKAPKPPKDTAQHRKSKDKTFPKFEGVETTSTGHHIQTIKELQTVHVIVTSDMSKSPPVVKVLSLNPFF